MFMVFLGFVMLLAIVVPFGGALIQLATGGMYGSFFRDFPPFIYHLATITSAYLPIVIVVGIFLSKTNLRARLLIQCRVRLGFCWASFLACFLLALSSSRQQFREVGRALRWRSLCLSLRSLQRYC